MSVPHATSRQAPFHWPAIRRPGPSQRDQFRRRRLSRSDPQRMQRGRRTAQRLRTAAERRNNYHLQTWPHTQQCQRARPARREEGGRPWEGEGPRGGVGGVWGAWAPVRNRHISTTCSPWCGGGTVLKTDTAFLRRDSPSDGRKALGSGRPSLSLWGLGWHLSAPNRTRRGRGDGRQLRVVRLPVLGVGAFALVYPLH